MAAENINERGRPAWLWLRRQESAVPADAPAPDATHPEGPPPESEFDEHSRDAEMILAVFRTVVLIVALLGPRLFGRALEPREIALAALAGIYNIAVAISCAHPRRYGLRRPFIVTMDILLITVWIQFTSNAALVQFYYVVVIMAALWFRVFGGLVAAAFCNFFFLFLLGRLANEFELPLDFSAVALNTGLLFLVGCLVGYISEAQELERQRSLEDQLLIANYQREIDLSTHLQPLLMSTETADAASDTRKLDPHLEAGVAMQSARSLGGGDYFDILPLPGGKTALFIADVSGKSVRAQARLPLLKYALRALAPLYPDPANLLTRLNETLAPDLQPELFIALCCVVLDPAHHTLSWTNAGHIAPLLLPQAPPDGDNLESADGEVCPALLPLETDGPALGMFAETVYEARTLPWLPGDQLLLFTDGLVDALSYGGSEDGEMQVKRLCGRLARGRRLGVREEAQNFVDMAVAAFDAAMPLAQRLHLSGKASIAAPSAQRDDVTVALIRFRNS